MKHTKKLFAAVLAMSMVLALGTTSFAAVEDTGYTDVDAGDWYAGAVAYVTEHHLMNGTGGARFSPNIPTDLAMLVTILHRDAGTPAASAAVPDGASGWYADAAAWASGKGFLADVNNAFTSPMTREDMITVLWRYAESPDGNSSDFVDEADIASYASQAVDWSRANHVVDGKPGNLFDPKGNATRAELATILQNFLTMDQQTAESQHKSLVAYFAYSENIGDTSGMEVDAVTSASLNAHTDNETGNLQVMAKELQDKLGADVHQILVTESYNPTYEIMRERANQELQSGYLPALNSKISDLDQYDVIYLGTPVWFGTLPPAVSAFLHENDLTGHTIVPIGIHLGSGFGSIIQQIEELCPNATVAEGFTVRANTSNAQVKAEFGLWLEQQTSPEELKNLY